MAQAIYINGEYFTREDAKISVYDHGLLYGDGVFEGMRIYNGKVFALEDHLVRLYESARAIALTLPIDIDAMRSAVEATVEKNGLSEAYVRLVCTRGNNQLGLDPNRCEDPQVIIIVDKISLYPEKYYTEGLDLITASTIRNHPAALSPRIKSLNYPNNIMAKIEAIRAGCIEAVMLNHKGEVAECTGDNIFIVRRGRLLTPPVHAGILEGITRNTVMELARGAGIEVAEETLTRHDLFIADECFLTGSAAEVIPAVRLDGRLIADGNVGPITKQLNELFRAHVGSV